MTPRHCPFCASNDIRPETGDCDLTLPGNFKSQIRCYSCGAAGSISFGNRFPESAETKALFSWNDATKRPATRLEMISNLNKAVFGLTSLAALASFAFFEGALTKGFFWTLGSSLAVGAVLSILAGIQLFKTRQAQHQAVERELKALHDAAEEITRDKFQ